VRARSCPFLPRDVVCYVYLPPFTANHRCTIRIIGIHYSVWRRWLWRRGGRHMIWGGGAIVHDYNNKSAVWLGPVVGHYKYYTYNITLLLLMYCCLNYCHTALQVFICTSLVCMSYNYTHCTVAMYRHGAAAVSAIM